MASIVTLKTGQCLIAEVNEMFRGEEEDRTGIGLQLRDPFILELFENPEAENIEDRNRVKFSRWNPFTLERVFRIPYDAVVAVSQPDPNLETAFKEKQSFFDDTDAAEVIESTGDVDDTATETAE